ncbi:hypothetical protein FE257_005600 [Aspergillus nanangensis]|uniref:Uncharacterized protein n=1 Tax=Aspergillus nanangensis TaxID=2582783 RepID=A0AAD4CQ97_ASPNN|nr:hypothetical protein FE257_005600 [Aspergillus nanangensis]
MSHNILITGASGYLGGTLLARWKSSSMPPYSHLYALVRTPEQAESVKQYGAEPLFLDLDNHDEVISTIVDRKISIIFYLIGVHSARRQLTLLDGLAQVQQATGQQVHFLQTGGAKQFSSHAGMPQKGSFADTDPRIYDLQRNTPMPQNIMRDTLQVLCDVIDRADTLGIRSYIFVPCVVYGKGEGFGNKISIQDVAIVRAAQKLRQVYQVDLGDPAWPVCHVADTADLYIHLLRKILLGEDIGYGKNGYYLAASGFLPWSKMYEALAKGLAKRGVVDHPTVEQADEKALAQMGEALNVPGPVVPVLLGGNCIFSPEHGTRKVTYQMLANVVNGMAWWLTTTLDPSPQFSSFETLAYIGPNDMGHNIVLLGAIKAGYKILLVSPRYGTIGQARLMKETNCTKLLLSPATSTSSQADALATEVPNLRVWTLPDLPSLLDTQHPPFPYSKSYEQAKHDPLVVVHTSGTSGLPKPIVWTHEWAVAFVHQRHLPPPAGFESLDATLCNTRILSLMPPFHAGHLFASLLLTLYCGSTCIWPPAEMPPTAQTAAYMARNVVLDALWLLPAQIDELGGDERLLDIIRQSGVSTAFWAGGSVLHPSAEAVSKHLRLFSTCGSTETGMWPSIRRAGDWDPDTWRYMCFHPGAQIRFDEQADGLFGAVFEKKQPPRGEMPPAFLIVAQEEEFDTKDLFRRHSTLGDVPCWTYHGRSDDLQVFQTGFKWHPVAAERRIVAESGGLVQEALLVGTGRTEIVALLELSQEKEVQGKLSEVLDAIWPTIEEVNRSAPVYVHISRKRVVFTDAVRPMARTAKGNVQRSQTVKEYERQIQNVLLDVHLTQTPY